MNLTGRLGAATAALVLASSASFSATPLSEVRVSPDTTVTLGTSTVDDETIAIDDLAGHYAALGLGGIPPETDLDAYALLPNGQQLISFDTTVNLFDGSTPKPGDVWRYNGVGYTVEFDAAARGVPGGANLDAVAVYGGALLLSFDIAIDVGIAVEPEDLVRFDGTGFSLFFDGSAAGVAPGLNLDAADYLPCNGHLLLSFDGSGSIGGVDFDDEDMLEFNRVSTWEMAYDGTAEDVRWGDVDLDAVQAKVNVGAGSPLTFGQTVTVAANKATFQWSSVAAYRMVRGSFTSSASIGTYAVNNTQQGTANTFSDAAVPPAGTGYWYLVKRGGCGPTSWQSTLGLEPGRDTNIP